MVSLLPSLCDGTRVRLCEATSSLRDAGAGGARVSDVREVRRMRGEFRSATLVSVTDGKMSSCPLRPRSYATDRSPRYVVQDVSASCLMNF